MLCDFGLNHAASMDARPAPTINRKYWEIIADNLSKAGWSWGCVSAIDSNGRTIWIADAHRCDGKRFVVRSFVRKRPPIERHLDSHVRADDLLADLHFPL